MNLSSTLGSLGAFQLYLVNLLLALTFLTLAALVLLRGCRSLPVRAGIYRAVLLLLLGCPLLPALAGVTGTGLWSVGTGREGGPGEVGRAGVDPPAPLGRPSPHSFWPAPWGAGEGEEERAPALRAGSADLLTWAALALWGVGAAGVGFNLARARRRLASVLARTRQPGRELQLRVDAIARDLGVRPAPVLRLSAEIASPFASGLGRPVMVLPLEPSCPRLRETSILHELGHFALGHQREKGLLLLLRLVFWFHPALRLLTRRIGSLQEESCDAFVLSRGVSPKKYIQALARFAGAACGNPIPVLGFRAERNALEKRVRRIIAMKESQNTDRRTWPLTALAVPVLAAAALGLNVARPVPGPEGGKPGSLRGEAQEKRTPAPPRRLRSYDFSAFLTGERARSGGPGEEGPEKGKKDREAGDAAQDAFIGLLRDALGLAEETRVLPGRHGHVIVLATAAVHREIERFRKLNLAARATGAPAFLLHVELFELAGKDRDGTGLAGLAEVGLPSGGLPGVLRVSREKARRVREQLRREKGVRHLRDSTVLVRALLPAQVEALNVVSYVKDFKVRVRRAHAIADPVVGAVEEGVRVQVIPALVRADRVALVVRAARATLQRPIPTREMNIGGTHPVTIQLPRLQVHRQGGAIRTAGGGRAGLFLFPLGQGPGVLGVVTLDRVP